MAIPTTLAVGSIIAGDYRVDAMLGHGGMGVVYQATRLSVRGPCAVKVMRPELVDTPQLRDEFLREADLAAQLASPHIVRILASGLDVAQQTPWMAMELLAGSDLARTVEEQGPLSEREARVLFTQLAAAMETAHGKNIIHRDLKPENIFMTPTTSGFVARVLDFGLAKVIEAWQSAAITGRIAGSPLWMAPEQWSVQPLRPATDVWALGLVAFFALTGRWFWKSAYDRTPLAGLMTECLSAPMPLASERARELSSGAELGPEFDAWFAKATQREPKQRFAGGAEALRALLAVKRWTPPPNRSALDPSLDETDPGAATLPPGRAR